MKNTGKCTPGFIQLNSHNFRTSKFKWLTYRGLAHKPWKCYKNCAKFRIVLDIHITYYWSTTDPCCCMSRLKIITSRMPTGHLPVFWLLREPFWGFCPTAVTLHRRGWNLALNGPLTSGPLHAKFQGPHYAKFYPHQCRVAYVGWKTSKLSQVIKILVYTLSLQPSCQ